MLNWLYFALAFFAFLELVAIKTAFKSIADSYAVWAANTILDIDVTKLSANIEAVEALGAKLTDKDKFVT